MVLLRKLRVLIVDDEEHIRELLSSSMSYFNFEIVGKAANGVEAEKLYRETHPDLTLLDINMPIKTGVKALEEILSEFPDAFIIMLTAVSDAESVKKCISLGASYFIRKDTPLPKMIELIQEAVKNFEKKRKLNAKKHITNIVISENKEGEKGMFIDKRNIKKDA